MSSANNAVLKQMWADPRYRHFAFELHELFRDDPHYDPRRLPLILEGAARGERIVRFQDQYVVSSFVPPLPSQAFLTYLRGGQHEDQLLTDLAFTRRKAPMTVHVCITARCNYHCSHCGATTDRQAELTGGQWIDLMRRLQELGIAYISISGGEPLLRDDLEEILAAIDERSVTHMFTNGSKLTAKRARALKQAGLFYLTVSLDAPDPDEFNRFRRHPQAFEQACAAVENAVGAGFYTMISAVIFKKHLNQEYAFRLFRLARQLGAHEVRLHRPLPRGELVNPTEAKEVFYTPEEIRRLREIQFAANENDDLPKVSSFPYTEGPEKFGCGAGLMHSYISATGELWPCDFVPLSFGNLLEEGAPAVYSRMMAAAGDKPRLTCMACGVAGLLNGKKLPLGPEESREICERFRSRGYPDFFRKLQP